VGFAFANPTLFCFKRQELFRKRTKEKIFGIKTISKKNFTGFIPSILPKERTKEKIFGIKTISKKNFYRVYT